jgi:hypothetical protein
MVQIGKVKWWRDDSVCVGILEQYLLPFVETQKYNLSSNSCRLHPNNDIFHEQEEKIEQLRPMQWQCGYCHKVFRTQTYLDSHFDNRHSNMLGTVRCQVDPSYVLLSLRGLFIPRVRVVVMQTQEVVHCKTCF